MARSLRFASWLLSVLFAAAVVVGFAGCGVASQPLQPPPISDPPSDPCAAPVNPTSFSEQYLIGGDPLQSNAFFVYKLDQQTGVPTAMPWSPMRLDGFVNAETVDPSGHYFYLDVGKSLTSYSLETLRFPTDGSVPVQIDSQSLQADQLGFDPQQRYLYALREGNINNFHDPTIDAFLSIFQIDSNHVPHDTHQTLTLPDRAPSFGFEDDGRALVVSREHISSGNTSIAVLNRDCKSGSVISASETPILRSLHLVVPSVGKGILGYRLCCDPYAPSGSQLSAYDPTTHSVNAVPGGTLLDTYTPGIDHLSDFAVMVAAENPAQIASPADLLKVYRYSAAAVTLVQTDQYQFRPHADGSPEIPFGVVFDLSDSFVYVPIHNALAVFRLDHNTGKIVPLSGSPFSVPTLLDPIFVFGR